MTLASGYALLFAGLLAWLVGAHVKSLRYYDRPALARRRHFDPALILLAYLLAFLGLVQLGRGSRAALTWTCLVLLGLAAYRVYVRGAAFQRHLLRRDLEALERERPAMDREALLCLLIYRRHPGWGEELIEQMVRDYPQVDDLARVLARMERGFRGFRP